MAKKTITSKLIEEVEAGVEAISTPDFNEEDLTALTNLRKKLESAKNLREQPHDEFDGMTYTQYWLRNEELANTKIRPKVNKQDIQYQSGTLRTKLFSFLNSLLGLNLGGDISCFDKNDIMMNSLANAMEDIIEKTNELDDDEEKKILRQYELLKQGHVFVEEVWDDRETIDKEIPKDYGGKFNGVKIKTKIEQSLGRPKSNIISGLSVYLGDLTKYLISEQPYIFTATTESYDDLEKVYGKFENWEFVSKTITEFSGDSDKSNTVLGWKLLDTQEGKVEVIKYQDKPNNEYQILLNGIPMLPWGFPFAWGYNEYNITQQNLKPIRYNFAYGKSFIAENKNAIQLLDEMRKLALLKTQKSFMPPYLNLSGKVISSQVLFPGRITQGVGPNTLVPVNDKETQGVTAAEANVIADLERNIDQNTASQTFSGQREKGGNVTATQIVELQRQARIMMGIIITTASLLEKKLMELRLLNILQNWFDPVDQVVDSVRGGLKNRYRTISRMRNIDGEGMGTRMVLPTEELPTPQSVKTVEGKLKTVMGMPVKIIAINPTELKKAQLIWTISINPKEKKSSDLSKLMFETMVQTAAGMGLTLSQSFVKERFAEVWEEDPNKMFEQIAPPVPQPMGTQPNKQGAAGPSVGAPQVKMTPETNQPAPAIS